MPGYNALQAPFTYSPIQPYWYVGRYLHPSTELISIVTLQAQTVSPPCMRPVQ
jgi:hypothetical protein